MARVPRPGFADWTGRFGRRIEVPAAWFDPFRWPEGQFIDGPEGNWSTFPVSAGTPRQEFSVLFSTTSKHLSLPFAEDCEHDALPRSGLSRFSYRQRSDGFCHHHSSTWWEDDSSDLADAGWAVNTSDSNTVKRVRIQPAAPGRKHRGMLGLAQPLDSVPQTLLFGGPYDSLLAQMVVESWLSYSWGYTAGAAYRNASASFVLGGYDASRLDTTAHSFPFSDKRDMPLIAHLASLSVENGSPKSTDKAVPLLEASTPVLLDPSSPYYVFPETVCQKIQAAFGLEYEAASGLFIVNETTSQLLRNRESSLNVHLVEEHDPDSGLELLLPFSSLDVSIRRTIQDVEGPIYFPLRVAKEGEISVLGRAFFQETYMVVDYERRNFTLAQCRFPPADEPQSNATAIIMFRVNGRMQGINLLLNASFLVIGLFMAERLARLPSFLLQYLVARPRNHRLRRREKELERLWMEAHTVQEAPPTDLLHDD